MTAPITALEAHVSVATAAQVFLTKQISSAPVTHRDGSLAGVISEKDIMEALGHADGWNAPLAEVMTPRVIHYEPDTPAELIFQFLCRVQLHRVVIVENNRPVGLVSRGSFLRWIQNYVNVHQPVENPFDSRPELLRTADALTNRAQSLRDELQDEHDGVVVPVINGVSSIQVLIAELLSWARYSCPDNVRTTYAGLT